MRRINKVIILLFISVILISCGKKSYVVFDYNCNGDQSYECELKNNKLNCNVITPVCEGYRFKGWYSENDNPLDLKSNFKANEVIYAKWEKGGTVEPSSSEEPTSTIVTPGIIDTPSSSSEMPSSSRKETNSQEKPSSSSTPVNPPKPEETYTISFNLNGGTGGQTASISGVKYNNNLPSINQNKPVKPGYTFQGWYDSQNGGTQYYNSSNSPVRKYDKKGNITLYTHWTINTLSIEYNGNGGSWNSSNSTYGVNGSNTVIVKSTNQVYQKVLNYGEKLESSGLTDYNGSWFKWTRSGYTVESKKEYIIGSTVLDQAKVYSSIELSRYGGCDLSKTNCTITAKVNWKKLQDSGTLKIYYFGYGRYDSYLIQGNNTTIFIDGGTEYGGSYSLNLIKKLGVNKIDALIGSHLDNNHVDAHKYLIKNFSIGHVYYPDDPNTCITNKTCQGGSAANPTELAKLIKNNNIPMTVLKPSMNIKIGNITFDCVGPQTLYTTSQHYYASNYNSLNLILKFGNTKFYFAGDGIQETEILSKYGKETLKVDVFKYPHHGELVSGEAALSTDFVEVLSPRYVTIPNISNKLENKMNKFLNSIGAEIILTGVSRKNVLIESDGSNITVYKNYEIK